VAYINRFTVDVVSDEPMTESRAEQFAREMVNFGHVVQAEPEDLVHDEIDKNYNWHVHTNTDGESYCDFCVRTNAQDRLDGDVLIERSS
jgi:hypothetical protein